MRKLLFAALIGAGFGFAGSEAKAQYPGEAVMPGQPLGGSATGAGRYGWNTNITKVIFWWKKDKDAGCSDCKSHGHAMVPPPPGAPGGPMVGTLVFPHHQFTRSPRDFFMYGQGGN